MLKDGIPSAGWAAVLLVRLQILLKILKIFFCEKIDKEVRSDIISSKYF